jgi:hypothetical protein
MSALSDEKTVGNVTRTSQIMVGALVAGVVTTVAAAVLIDLRPRQQAAAQVEAGPGANNFAAWPPGGTAPIITYCAVAFAVVVLPVSFVVPDLVTRQGRQTIAQGRLHPPLSSGAAGPVAGAPAAATETGMLAALYMPNLIIGAAFHEGLAFFAAVAYMVEKNLIALGLALLLIALLIARFPTAGRVERWIEQQREKLHDEAYRA